VLLRASNNGWPHGAGRRARLTLATHFRYAFPGIAALPGRIRAVF
jgi:hypothetical protein